MDPLSLTASIIAVIQLAGKVAGVCRSYIEGVQDYPKDLLVLFIKIRLVAAVLEGLCLLKSNDPIDAATLKSLCSDNGPIHMWL